MMLFNSFILPWAVLALSLWNSRELAVVWTEHASLYEKNSWLLLLVWILPLIYYGAAFKKESYNSTLALIAILFCIAGTLGQVNHLHYAGLACSLAAFLPNKYLSYLWLLAAILWMPLISWAAARLISDLNYLFPFRLVILALSSLFVVRKLTIS